MFPCPNCKEIIRVGSPECRYCGSAIDDATASRLNLDFKHVTNAVASANTFKQSILLAVLLMVASPLYFFVLHGNDQRAVIVSAAPFVFLFYAISWHRKYGRIQTSDKEYPDAVRDMRRSFLVWTAALVVEVAVVGYALSSGVFSR